MDKEAATILADSIKGLQSAIMFWGIAYQEHTVFQRTQVEAELTRLEGILDNAEAKNNDSDNDGN